MKILVTGATGGIGRLLIPILLKTRHEVIATSKSLEKAKSLSFFNQVTYITYDFNQPLTDNLFQYFGKPDSVIHLAWDKLNDYKNEEHATTILENHKLFVQNLISNGLKKFNGVGTCYEYGLIEGELKETMKVSPKLPYPLAKYKLFEFIESLKSHYQFESKWLRIFYVFGEIYGRKNLFSLLNQAINDGHKTFNMSGGQQIRDFLSPEEIATLIASIAGQSKVNGIVNCCSGKPIMLVDFIKNYLKENNYEIELNLGYFPYPDYEPMNTWGNTEKLNKIILK